MDFYTTAVAFFQNGGLFMYPIAFVMSLGIAIAIERYYFLGKETRANRRDFETILPLLRARRTKELAEMAAKSRSAVGRMMTDGLARMAATRRRQDIEYAMEEQLLQVLPSIERRTPYLATFANVATLLGLLGTITGLIGAFTAVADADPSEKAALLSQSISIAMNCTAFGLITAIPLLLIHSFLQTKTSTIVESLEIAMVKFLNLLEERPSGEAHSGTRPQPGTPVEARAPAQAPSANRGPVKGMAAKA